MKRAPTSVPALIAEAAAWRLLEVLFERPRPGWHGEITALAAEVRARDLRAAATAAHDGTEGRYLALLGPGGAVSPREVSYRPREDPGHVLAELAAVYEAFHYRPRREDPIDHIAVEVGFVGFLLLKAAFARQAGDQAAVEAVRAGTTQFVEAHLASFGRSFAARLEACGECYLRAPARALVHRLPAAPTVVPAGATEDGGGCETCPSQLRPLA